MTPRILIILLLQTIALGTMVGMKQYTLNTGTPILLETQPVDPRSLFRGDYVRLRYTISDLDLDTLGGEDEFKRHVSIYVVLEKGETYWEPVSVHNEQPDINNDQVFIKGEVKRAYQTTWNPDTKQSEPANRLTVRYGIENYFVPEGEGLDLERRRNDEQVDIQVAVDKYGNAGIQAVLVNGEERYRETLF